MKIRLRVGIASAEHRTYVAVGAIHPYMILLIVVSQSFIRHITTPRRLTEKDRVQSKPWRAALFPQASETTFI
jgi:hypothetical protein